MTSIKRKYLRGNKPRAYSMVELIVAIAIIGAIFTISTLSINKARQSSRDLKRLNDAGKIQTALLSYFVDEKMYPENIIPGASLMGSTSSTTYMKIIPEAISPADGSCTTNQNTFFYQQTPGGVSYTLSFCLGGETGQLSSGPKCLTPAGILDIDCSSGEDEPFVCGDNLIDERDSQVYSTVEIGTQCWMAEAMNIGTMILGASNQTDNSILEKYCYDNVEAKCTSDGGLYQWGEVLQYNMVEGAQGICPPGWHVPTDSEQNILDQYLTDSPNTCNPIRVSADCANAGTKLQPGGSSGFEGVLAGLRSINGLFYSIGTGGYFWSSSLIGVGDDIVVRSLSQGSPLVSRSQATNTGDNTGGFSVHCIKD